MDYGDLAHAVCALIMAAVLMIGWKITDYQAHKEVEKMKHEKD